MFRRKALIAAQGKAMVSPAYRKDILSTPPQSKFQEPTTSKSLKGFKLWRTSNLTFSKTSLKLHTKKQWLGLSLRIIEYPTNEYKTFSYTFRIDQFHLPMVKEKRNGLTFPEFSVKICWFLQLSPPYWKWSQHNAMQSECTQHLPQNHPEINALWKHIIYEIFSEQGDWTRQVWKNVLKSHFFPLASSWNKTSKILAITFIS